MRIIKLNIIKEFPTFEQLVHYFEYDLPSRNPPGKFLLPKGWIAEGGLEPGERVLFSYKCRVRFVAHAASGRIKNTDEEQKNYPCFFTIDLSSVQQTDFSLKKLEDLLRHEANENKRIVRTQGWPRIIETKIIKSVVESLINSSFNA